jgi:hypothetical protein
MNDIDKIEATEFILQEEEKFKLLQQTDQYFSVAERFELSRSISSQVTSNDCLRNYCIADNDVSARRKGLLENIQSYQQSIIKTIANQSSVLSLDETYNVRDFDSASRTLLNLTEEELNHGFVKNVPSDLQKNITGYSSHLSTLENVVSHLQGDVYNILIVGEYQSGKTTLINAIVGKPVGAIGDGNATSAVPVSYTYGKHESIKIVLRSKERIMELLSILGRYIEDANLDSFDIDDATQRATLLNQLNLLRRDENRCPLIGDPGCKAIAICGIILRYYGTTALKNAVDRKYSIHDIAYLTRFPKGNNGSEFHAIWKKRGEQAFNINVSLFAFIERVECVIDSRNLKKLNCSIVDSPGLFSNDYDTLVTENEMRRADAILYVLPYDKKASQFNNSSLITIRDKYPDVVRKLFVVNNHNSADRKKNFVEANRATLYGA